MDDCPLCSHVISARLHHTQANAKAAGDIAGDKYEAAKGTASEYAAAGQQKAGEAYDATVGGAAQVLPPLVALPCEKRTLRLRLHTRVGL